MITAIIFDLDNCLAAADEPGPEIFEPAFAAMRATNRGVLSPETLAEAFAACWFHSLDWVAARYGFSDEMLAAGWEVLATTEVRQPMQGYGDLAALSELPARRFLVTSGFRRLQQSKIRALGVEALFDGVQIDAIDEPDRTGKLGIFQRLMAEHRLTPSEILVVGDNAESELAVGLQLGLTTVQTLRPGVVRADAACHHIHSLWELAPFLVKGT